MLPELFLPPFCVFSLPSLLRVSLFLQLANGCTILSCSCTQGLHDFYFFASFYKVSLCIFMNMMRFLFLHGPRSAFNSSANNLRLQTLAALLLINSEWPSYVKLYNALQLFFHNIWPHVCTSFRLHALPWLPQTAPPFPLFLFRFMFSPSFQSCRLVVSICVCVCEGTEGRSFKSFISPGIIHPLWVSAL